MDSQTVIGEIGTSPCNGFRRRFVANLLKLLPIDLRNYDTEATPRYKSHAG